MLSRLTVDPRSPPRSTVANRLQGSPAPTPTAPTDGEGPPSHHETEAPAAEQRGVESTVVVVEGVATVVDSTARRGIPGGNTRREGPPSAVAAALGMPTRPQGAH